MGASAGPNRTPAAAIARAALNSGAGRGRLEVPHDALFCGPIAWVGRGCSRYSVGEKPDEKPRIEHRDRGAVVLCRSWLWRVSQRGSHGSSDGLSELHQA